MKKIFYFLALAALVSSCSDDDSSQTNNGEPFFNLTEGNLWVYKKYYSNSTGEVVFTNNIDTVRITGQEEFEGQSYFRLHHKIYGSGQFTEEWHEYLRVNENGHLVNPAGVVIHPGTDNQYQFTDNIEGIGQILYQLEEIQEKNIEGSDFTVYPYVGIFTPLGEGLPAGVGCFVDYEPGIGLVAKHNRYLAGTEYIEYRLVHYEIN